jgi:hypothetical protein
MRAVACHVLGASFWLPVPTVLCSCCNRTWEVQPSDAGFFGNSPIVPGVWFSTQLLSLYTCLYNAGLSATNYADSLSKTAARVDNYLPTMPRTVAFISNIDDR